MNLSRRKFISTSAKCAVAVTVLRSFVPARAAEQAAAVQPLFARLDQYIARHMTETGVPGMTLALANRDGLIRVSTYGYADTKAGARVVPETMFEIGSISKSFVGLILLQLRDEGKLDLNKPIVEYLPWLKVNSKFEAITPHHILTHSAGLPGAPLTIDALLGELWTAYAPGKRFLYSNIGYIILGFLIEALDKRPFAESMRTRMLVPLGMNASAPLITHDLRKQMAVGYKPLEDAKPFQLRGPLAEAQWIEVDLAAGSIASTPGDMAKYLRMLLNRGALPKGRLVSEEGFAVFTKPAINSPYRGEPASYGYGVWVSDIEGHTRLRHTGGMVAFSSSMDIDVTAGIGAFASVNANLRGYRPVAVTRYAVDLFNASLAAKSLPDPPAAPPSPAEVKNAADYAGLYTTTDGKKLELSAEGDKLFLVHGNRKVVLERAGTDRFFVKHPDFDRFLLGFERENKQVTQAFFGSDWYLGEKYTGPKTFETKKEWEAFAGHYYNDSPWYGDIRIVLRKGQLLLEGLQPLTVRSDGKFAFGDPEGPDWITFESIVDGRAMRMNWSGIIYRRTFTP